MSFFDNSNKKKQNTLNVMGITSVLDDYLLGINQAKYIFFVVKPLNISVLSNEIVTSKIIGLTTTLKTIENIEILCINSSQSYEKNKEFLKQRLEKETKPAIKKLLIQDMQFLDQIRISMSTSREFLLCLRFANNTGMDAISMVVKRTIQTSTEGGLTTTLATKNDLKRLLSIYYEQNVFDDTTPDLEGQQYCDEV